MKRQGNIFRISLSCKRDLVDLHTPSVVSRSSLFLSALSCCMYSRGGGGGEGEQAVVSFSRLVRKALAVGEKSSV